MQKYIISDFSGLEIQIKMFMGCNVSLKLEEKFALCSRLQALLCSCLCCVTSIFAAFTGVSPSLPFYTFSDIFHRKIFLDLVTTQTMQDVLSSGFLVPESEMTLNW